MSNSTAPGSTSQLPTIRTFQLDSSSQGNASSSVNLFRGDVNLSQTLFTLPGRSGSGLDVSVAVQYQSNVFRAAGTWNADAPTGVLGLGWTLPLTYIAAQPGGSPVAATRQYVFYDKGSANSLYRQSVKPVLLVAAGDCTSNLVDGETMPDRLRQVFLRHGLPLDGDARISGEGPWLLKDDANRRTFELRAADAGLEILDGGELYQLQNYAFWKVLYEPEYEAWLVVDDAGISRYFGGRTADVEGCATAQGNSVAWSVWWKGDGEEPLWTGASDETSGQVQVATAWYLTELNDRFGSTVNLRYNCWQRGEDGIIPVVEQRVGEGGLPYTKAVYLGEVVDAFGRKACFRYGDKLWESSPESPREYADPHQAAPSNDPGPYQDCYETRYLREIDVAAASGEPLFSTFFGFQITSVSGAEGSLEGDTAKRFLTSIAQVGQDGEAQPALRFDYDLDPTTPGQPGALLAITNASGAITSYDYTCQSLDLTDRTLTVERPSGVPEGATPRVFFGPNYAVVTYYNQNSLELSLEVYTWVGTWLGWQPTDSAMIDNLGMADIDSLEVLAQSDFLVLTFARSDQQQPVYVFQSDVAKPGQWQPALLDGQPTGVNQPTLTYTSGGTLTFSGGSTFFLVSQLDVNKPQDYCYDVLTWRWSTTSWSRETVSSANVYFWIVAANEYYVVLDSSGGLTPHFLDGELQWNTAPAVSIEGLHTSDPQGIQLVPGAAMVVVANLLSGGTGSTQNTYTLTVVEWDATYQANAQSSNQITDVFGQGNAPLPWTPQIIDDTLVGTNGNLLRRGGAGWSLDTTLNLGSPPANTEQRYAYGIDYAIQVLEPSNGVGSATATVVSYDPTQSRPWTSGTPGQTLPTPTADANWPSAGSSSWAAIGPYVYFRGTSTDWAQVFAAPPTADLSQIAGAGYLSASLVNEGPNFLAYEAGPSAEAVMLHNGVVSATPSIFADQKLELIDDPEASGAGLSPQGPSLFVSYPAATQGFEQAQTIYLHAYAGDAVDGPITHYTVTRVTIDDSFGEPTFATFDPDTSTAGVDPSGEVVKFFQNTLYPGADSVASATSGRIVSQYINGLKDVTGDNYYDMLDGLLLSTEVFIQGEDSPVQSKTTTWVVFEQVASSPTDPSAPAIQLRGGWVTQEQQDCLVDGMTTTTLTGFVPEQLSRPYTGRQVSQSRQQADGAGEPETFARLTTYGVEVEPALVAIHAFADVAQVVNTWQNAKTKTPLSLSATATPFSPWPTAFESKPFTPAPVASFQMATANQGDFPFTTYRPGDEVPGWQLDSRITARTSYGQTSESIDGLGVFSAYLFDARDEVPVAQVINAGLAGWAYLGFQRYEDTSAWTLNSVEYDGDDAFSGTRSALLAADAQASVQTTVTATSAQTYVVGCRYQVPAGGDAKGSLRATVTVDGVPQPSVTVSLAKNDGQWHYLTLPVSLPAGSSFSIAVEASNSATELHLDSLLVAPLVSTVTARTFDPLWKQVMATMDRGGRTSKTYYNSTRQPAISVGAGELVRELGVSFCSRRGNGDDQFDPDSPNAELTLKPAAGGVLETFRDGGSWRSRWATTGSWVVEEGSLGSHGTASLSWKGSLAGDSYALYFEVTAAPGSSPSVDVGDIQIAWKDPGYSAEQGGEPWTALATPPTVARRWLVVVNASVVLFFADGQLVFSEAAQPDSHSLTIHVDTAVLRHLTVVGKVRLGLSYNDAAARQRQAHQLHDNTSYLCQTVYDTLGRRIATTKSAPGNFGSGTAAVMGYSSSFLDVGAFLANLGPTGTGTMEGNVAEYYQGQTENGVTRPDDEGYPYWGVSYESSPRSNRVESSQPGKDYATNPSVEPSQRQTMMYAYGSTEGETRLPAGQYAETRMTGPLKTVSTQVDDQLGQRVASSVLGTDGSLQSRSEGLRGYDTSDRGSGAALVQPTPNAMIPGPQTASDHFSNRTVANALRQTLELDDVDSGRNRFVYDSKGNLRFVQPALDPGEMWFIYFKYDVLGRVVEEGTLQSAWDRSSLRTQADDPSYPESGEVAVATFYDGDGHDATLLGMKWRSQANNPAPAAIPGAAACTVVETFAYDEGGNILSVTQAVSGPIEQSGTLGYAYDVLGEVVRVDLPEGAPIASIYYRYDDQGNLVDIGTSEGGNELGHFVYSAAGQVIIQEYAGGAWTRTLNYAPPGWILDLATTSKDGSKSLDLAMSYAADGMMLSRQVTNKLGMGSSFDDTFTYDPQRRLASADGDSDVQLSQYDPNGNLWTVDQGGETTQLVCQPASNRLATVTVGDGPVEAIVYDARGEMTSGLGRNLSYDAATGMTTAITQGGTQMRLAYGGLQQRVLGQVGSTTRVDFMGAGQVPVASWVDGWEISVQGPTGLLAYISDQAYFPLSDPTGSVWAVVTADDVVGTSTYRPFGSIVSEAGQPEKIPYRYQGQPWLAEVGLCEFGMRLYDPSLRRFLAPDPMRQFASPYVFAANTPLVLTDPSGEMSLWARVGVDTGLVAITIVGFALTLPTGGSSDAGVAAFDATVIGGEFAADASTDAAVSATLDAASDAAGDAAVGAADASGAGEASAAASEVDAGATISNSILDSGASFATSVSGSMLQSAGVSGLKYEAANGRNSTLKGLLEAAGIGAASGLVSGTVGACFDSSKWVDEKGVKGVKALVLKTTLAAGLGAVKGILSQDVSTVLTNLTQSNQTWYQGLAGSTRRGAWVGATYNGGLQAAASGSPLLLQTMNEQQVITDATAETFMTLPDMAQSAVASDTGLAIASTASFFVISGYVVWGAQSKGHHGSS